MLGVCVGRGFGKGPALQTKGRIMLGIQDPWVALAYLLCIASSALCVIYGWLNWNRGDEEVKDEDVRWAAEEDKAEDKL